MCGVSRCIRRFGAQRWRDLPTHPAIAEVCGFVCRPVWIWRRRLCRRGWRGCFRSTAATRAFNTGITACRIRRPAFHRMIVAAGVDRGPVVRAGQLPALPKEHVQRQPCKEAGDNVDHGGENRVQLRPPAEKSGIWAIHSAWSTADRDPHPYAKCNERGGGVGLRGGRRMQSSRSPSSWPSLSARRSICR